MCPFTIKEATVSSFPCQPQGPGLHFIKQGGAVGEGESGLLHDAMFSSAHSNTHISMTETAKPATGPEEDIPLARMHFTEVGLGAGELKGPRSCYCED